MYLKKYTMKTGTAIIHETRRTLADGTHPIKLRITHNRKQKYYTLNVTTQTKGLSVDDWKKVISERPRGEFKALHDSLNKLEAEAIEIIKALPEFSFEAFEAVYFKKQSTVDLFAAMKATAKAMRGEGKIKTASTYESALKSFSTFAKSDTMPFSKVTVDYLKKYEKWMLTQGKITEVAKSKRKDKNIAEFKHSANSTTTLSIYIRTIRATFNKVGITDDSYPFGRNKYQVPTGRNVKKALTLQDIAKIFRYDAPPKSTREIYRDYWMLSYLCNGANIKDLALLKYKNIDSDSITFVRAKTAGKIKRAVVIPLTVEIARLIDKYGQKPATPDSYILPILRTGMSHEQQRVAIDNTVRAINKHIKVIAANIGINANVTSYTARHSFATVLKRSGASIEFISESLGHSNLQTTENYLADFEMDKKREMAAILTNWDNG
jgi:integrase/recombinase XerD